jgi:hypothetical protein
MLRPVVNNVHRRALTALCLGLACLVSAAVAPSSASAATYAPWEEGLRGNPFHLVRPVSPAVAVLGDDDQWLELARVALTDIGPSAPLWDDLPEGQSPDPRMAYPLGDGVLISGGKNVAYVKQVDASGQVVWDYRNGTDGLLRRPFSAEPATFNGRACILISDRIACRVFAVDRETKQTVWQYGTTDVPGSGVNQLADPFCATQIAPAGGQVNGNVLIADSNDNHRVIEIRSDDFDASAADMGYSSFSIVWQYGVTGRHGSAPGYLNQARSPQRLPDGDTLITDAAGQRVIAVRTSDYDPEKPDNGYSASSITWSYVNDEDGAMGDPNTARYISTGSLAGNIAVTDCDSSAQWVRIIDFETKKTVETINLRTFARPGYVDPSDLSSPRDARVGGDGTLWIADAGFGRVMRVGNEDEGTVTSRSLDCGEPDMLKAFSRLKIQASSQPAGTSFTLWYRVDGEEFRVARISSDGRNVNLPGGTSGKRIAYRVRLESGDPWRTPVFDGLTIHFSKASTGGSGGGGGGAEGGSGNSGQAGTYSYPPAAEGGTGTSGTGSGSGSYGTGTGSGTSGAGSGSSASGSGSSAVAASVDVPVQSTGSGAAQPVEGLEVRGQEGVSGVPLRAEEGAQAPGPERAGTSVPVLALAAAGLLVAAAFFMPWPLVAAQMRRITDFDHTRRGRVPPFRPLRR